MKISISYPPIPGIKGTPMISQNRQYQVFSAPTYIYPMVPAYAATLLDHAGHEVAWNDGIAEGKTYREWLRGLERVSPDVVAMETKTPVVKAHWDIINDLKEVLPESKIVLMGDHVTALPRESMENSLADFVLTGGDYDFLLLNLCNHLTKSAELEPGIWYRKNGDIKNTGTFKLDHDLNSLPLIDRDLTNWKLYSEKNGNYKRTPGTYTMVGRDCWWAKCSFCSWPTLFPKFRTRSPSLLLDEIGILIEKYRVKEIFDDTGTFPTGAWLKKFCKGVIKRGYSDKVRLSCNMRVNALNQEEYNLMRKAGFRMLLFGLESANQRTLDKLNKGIKVDDIFNACRMAKKAGLEPHLTVMVGYPWESREDASRTLDLAKELFKKGWADSLQATIVIPYPGTPLFKDCKENSWLSTEDWSLYDMRENVMTSPLSDDEIKQLTQGLYKVFFTPQYAFRKLLSIRSFDDLRFIKKGVVAITGHLKDFSRGRMR